MKKALLISIGFSVFGGFSLLTINLINIDILPPKKEKATSITTEYHETILKNNGYQEENQSPELVSLFDMEAFIGNIGDIVSYTVPPSNKDNRGNEYPYSIYCSNYQANIHGPESVTYFLDGEYRELNFSLGLRNEENDTSAHGWLEFYSIVKDKNNKETEEKIFSTDKFTAGVEPQSYTIDITGVKKLKIVVCSDSGYYNISGYVFLLTNEFMLSK